MSVTVKTAKAQVELDRRGLLRCAALCGALAPMVAACGSDSETPAAPADDAEEGSTGPLVAAADVPVGGGVVLDGEGVIVTQPTEGEFVGYTTTCTHQGGAVTSVSDKGVMTCSLHGSQFSIEGGKNLAGPNGQAAGTTADLPTVPLKNEGGQIFRG